MVFFIVIIYFKNRRFVEEQKRFIRHISIRLMRGDCCSDTSRRETRQTERNNKYNTKPEMVKSTKTPLLQNTLAVKDSNRSVVKTKPIAYSVSSVTYCPQHKNDAYGGFLFGFLKRWFTCGSQYQPMHSSENFEDTILITVVEGKTYREFDSR